ncbi:TetR/AcrR family transcriptional regulator [Sinimarinibacterium sp. CAU 1509]|uniref:TetR/AcrR family transcriptional regulator n=1 Tax=Sinimarinibacterium sp. CAU 1509 TaxID=2562283 RepID=UPI00146AA25A|nr:TetR/AcrR family transcriptional regulator [Sinimarinibacterium sp. CAU 1509]
MKVAPDDNQGIAVRAALLAAGLRVLATNPPDQVTPEKVAHEAGVEVAAFARHFSSMPDFLCAALAQLSDRVRDKVARIMTNMSPGLPRLQVAVETYLEASRHTPLLRSLSLHLRSDPHYVEFLRSRVAGFSLMMELELRTLKHPFPAETARLLTAAAMEVGATETLAGKRQPALREAWLRFCETAAQ